MSTRPVVSFLTDSYVFDWKSQSFRADLIFILPLALCLGLGLALDHPGAALIATPAINISHPATTIGFTGNLSSLDSTEPAAQERALASTMIAPSTCCGTWKAPPRALCRV